MANIIREAQGTTLMGAELTHHAKVERAERIEQIKEKIGFGQVIKEVYRCNYDKAQVGNMGVYLCLTDTGVTLVKDGLKEKIITAYVTTFRELVQCYNGVKNIPVFLRRKVDRNQSYYTKHGKTVWK